MRFFYRVLLALAAALAVLPAWAAHGYALWGDLKYPAGFAHFDYVNPLAPRAGDLRLVSNSRASTFDKYNPFTIKGSAPSYLSDVMFDSLLVGSLDETGSGYGLLAEDVSVAADGLSATFKLRPQARFHDGSPVLASAAYNAGPGRARAWRADQTMEAAVYAESIPFNETRDYVKKVMANSSYYANNFSQQMQSLKARIGVIEPRARDREKPLGDTP